MGLTHTHTHTFSLRPSVQDNADSRPFFSADEVEDLADGLGKIVQKMLRAALLVFCRCCNWRRSRVMSTVGEVLL